MAYIFIQITIFPDHVVTKDCAWRLLTWTSATRDSTISLKGARHSWSNCVSQFISTGTAFLQKEKSLRDATFTRKPLQHECLWSYHSLHLRNLLFVPLEIQWKHANFCFAVPTSKPEAFLASQVCDSYSPRSAFFWFLTYTVCEERNISVSLLVSQWRLGIR